MTLAEPVLTISIFSQAIAPITNTSGTLSIAYSGTVGNEDEMAKRCWRLRPWYRMMISDSRIHPWGRSDEGGWMAQDRTALSVGDAAPPFTLRTSEGQEIRLADVLNSRAAILVFIRGTW